MDGPRHLLGQKGGQQIFVPIWAFLNVDSGRFINRALANEHSLEATETDKPSLEAEDLLEVLWCHSTTNTNIRCD